MDKSEIISSIKRKLPIGYDWIFNNRYYYTLTSINNKNIILQTTYNDIFYFDLNFNLFKIIWGHSSSIRESYISNNIRSRLDGPAIVYYEKRNSNLYFINNINYNKEEFSFKTNHILCQSCNDFCNQKCFL